MLKTALGFSKRNGFLGKEQFGCQGHIPSLKSGPLAGVSPASIVQEELLAQKGPDMMLRTRKAKETLTCRGLICCPHLGNQYSVSQ